MKIILFFKAIIIVYACCSISYAQDSILSKKLINKYEQLINHKEGRLSLTFFNKEVRKNYSQLTEEAKKMFSKLLARPTLNNEEVFSTVHFDIHYTQSGNDAVDQADSDSDGIPDYVESVAQIAESVWIKDSLYGLAIPPSDEGAGGSSRYDIYIADIGENLYGYEDSETNLFDNPNTSDVTEFNAWTSYLTINSDFSWAGDIIAALSVTIAHEYMHSIQSGYNEEMKLWLMEMTSTWAENFHYPQYTDNYEYLEGIFTTPDISLNLNDDDDPDGMGDHWYSTWIFAKYLCEHTDSTIIREILEKTVFTGTENAIDEVLQNNFSSDFKTEFRNFIIANLFLSSDSALSPYTYCNANVYSTYLSQNDMTLSIEEEILFDGSTQEYWSDYEGNSRLMRLGCDYIQIEADRNFTLNLCPDDYTAHLKMILVRRSSMNGFSITDAVVDGSNQVIKVDDYSPAESYMAIVYRDDWETDNTDDEQYILEVSNDYYFFKVYPNPVSEKIHIRYVSETSSPFIQIYDVKGDRISRISAAPSGQLEIPTTGFRPGTYIISLSEGKETLYTEKFFVK